MNVDSPAWPEIVQMAQEGDAEILPVDPVRGRDVLGRLQVTAQSYLGAMALNCGGIIADHGWFRLYGGGNELLPDLASINGLGEPGVTSERPGFVLVGVDVLGGRFAIDGGALGVAPGEVCYYGPDSLGWDGLGGGHAAFVSAVLSGALSDVFAEMRWEGWQDEVAALALNEGISVYPPPFTEQGRDLGAASRRAISIGELQEFYRDLGEGV